jgi:aminoglycoside phosphotransferase (APT) family kinase protein
MPMHADQQRIAAPLVRHLVARQFPLWAGRPLRRVRSAGTDHALYRLGADLAVRLPLRESSAQQVEKEQAWLPRLAPHLPLAVPAPVGLGTPDAGYPFPWSVLRWIEGATPPLAIATRDPAVGAELAGFVARLRSLDVFGGPTPGRHNFGRGAALATRDEPTRAAITALAGDIDAAAATAVWERGLAAAPHPMAAWIHGDLCPGNLILARGRLAAVIDFGGLAVGDPACDLIPAWNVLAGRRGMYSGTSWRRTAPPGRAGAPGPCRSP